MLPPPLDPSQIHPSKSTHDPMAVQAPAQEPRSRASSQVSTKSTTSSVMRKPAPPIPKKPALLTRSSDSGTSQQSKASAGERTSMSGPPRAGQWTPSGGPNVSFPPPPQRTTGAVAIGVSERRQRPRIVSPTQRLSEFDGPPLPRRRTGAGEP